MSVLSEVLSGLALPDDPSLLVGAASGDDAAVYRLDDTRAMVATIDFFTPIVDDANTWGRIAAVNAVSDVYAMGGRPLLALNVVAWNVEELGTDLLRELLSGGSAVAEEAGFVIAGGHSIDDPEPKYGLAVIGEVEIEHMLTNSGLLPGQVLVLTKPLGVGLWTTAAKRGLVTDTEMGPSIAEMTRLNAEAAAVALRAGATGATDVTGFGLLGHLSRAAKESSVDIVVDSERVPLLPRVFEFVEAGAVPGGGVRNREFVAPRVVAAGVADEMMTVLTDPQTSGGLVFGADPDRAVEAVDQLSGTGHTAAVIGRVSEGTGLLRVAVT